VEFAQGKPLEAMEHLEWCRDKLKQLPQYKLESQPFPPVHDVEYRLAHTYAALGRYASSSACACVST
jgi:hypothetical protein